MITIVIINASPSSSSDDPFSPFIHDNFSCNITMEIDEERIGVGFMTLDYSPSKSLLITLTLQKPTTTTTTHNAFINQLFEDDKDSQLSLYTQLNPFTYTLPIYTIFNGGECTVWKHIYNFQLSQQFRIPDNATLVERVTIKNGVHCMHWEFEYEMEGLQDKLLIHVWKSIFNQSLVAFRVDGTPWFNTIEISTYNVQLYKKKDENQFLSSSSLFIPERCRLQE
jgi:hypothetical protein